MRLPPATVARAPAGADQLKFSVELQELIARFRDRPASLADIFEATQGRGYYFALILIAVPFVGPIPLPGFSLPFGFTVATLGVRLVLDRGPWLPRRLLQTKLTPRVIASVFGAAGKLMGAVEIFVRPRLGFVSAHAVFSRIAGLFIALSGVMLMLPFPLPFSNSLPAWAVLFLSIGALGRDGLFFLLGCGAFFLSVAYFTLLAIGGAEAIDFLGRLFTLRPAP